MTNGRLELGVGEQSERARGGFRRAYPFAGAGGEAAGLRNGVA